MSSAKRWYTLVFAIVLVFTAAACSRRDVPSPTTPAATTATGTSTGKSGADPIEIKYENRIKVTMATVGVIDGYDYTAGDPYAKWWSDRFNWDFEVRGLSWDNWTEMLRIWINSRDLTDAAVFNYTSTTHPDAASWAEQGLIKRLPDDWRTRWPNVAEVFDVTTLGPHLEEIYGGVYYLPRARFVRNLPGDPLPNHMGVAIRKDWAKAVGFPIKDAYTPSELLEYGRLIKEQDPGNLGTRLLPMSFTPVHALDVFVRFNSTYFNTYYKDGDGTYKWGAASPDTLEGLLNYYRAYSSGILNPEFYTLRNDDPGEQFSVAGVSGMFYTGSVPSGMHMFFNNEFIATDNPFESIHLAIPVDAKGRYHQLDLINYWGSILFSPDIDDEVFERYMDMLDFAATEDGYRIQVAGFEGEDWELRNGGMVSLLPEGVVLEGTEGKYPSTGYTLGSIILWDEFGFDNPIYTAQLRARSHDLYQKRIQLGTPETFPHVDWTVWTFDSPNRRRASFDLATEFANIILNSTSEADVETKWNQWIASQRTLVQPVLDELNALQ